MKKCELCKNVARMYCDSDRASLCWDCDYRVHTANFIVSKHTRTLLCHACQSPTPWTGSGSKLGPTVSVCDSCANTRSARITDRKENEDDDAENQVVPFSLASTSEASTSSQSSRFCHMIRCQFCGKVHEYTFLIDRKKRRMVLRLRGSDHGKKVEGWRTNHVVKAYIVCL